MTVISAYIYSSWGKCPGGNVQGGISRIPFSLRRCQQTSKLARNNYVFFIS